MDKLEGFASITEVIGPVIGATSTYIAGQKGLLNQGNGEEASKTNVDQTTSRGSSGRTSPNNLKEQIVMKSVKSDPLDGATKIVEHSKMKDSRWLGTEGWVKYAKNIDGVEIHFNYNTITGAFDDFKFK